MKVHLERKNDKNRHHCQNKSTLSNLKWLIIVCYVGTKFNIFWFLWEMETFYLFLIMTVKRLSPFFKPFLFELFVSRQSILFFLKIWLSFVIFANKTWCTLFHILTNFNMRIEIWCSNVNSTFFLQASLFMHFELNF